MLLRTILIAAASAAALAATTAHAADTWDAVADFSITNGNPNGAWSYGTGVAGQSFTPMPVTVTSADGVSKGWTVSSPVLGTPAIFEDSAAFTSGTVLGLPGVLRVHPGPSTDVILRWTAPTSGTYDFSGSFEILDAFPTGVIGDVFANGTKEFSGLLTGPGANLAAKTPGGSESFGGSVSLNMGDTLTFAVNNDNNFLFDSTGLKATVTLEGPPPPPIPAVATLSSTNVNFGTVRAGTANVTAKTTVTNTATGFPVDDLNVVSATGLPTNVSVNGALPTGIASSLSGDIGFLLDTTTPGIVGGSATLGFTSTSSAESLTLPTQDVSFAGTVTQLANAVLVQDSGAGVFSGSGASYTLDLGSLQAGTGSVVTDLGALNGILNTAYGETLGGSFELGKGKGFSFTGSPFSGVVGGATDTGNLLSLDTTGLRNGLHTDTLTFLGFSSYPGLSDRGLTKITVDISANIFGVVPEPASWVQLIGGLGLIGGALRRRAWRLAA
jgi:hypothetical protein